MSERRVLLFAYLDRYAAIVIAFIASVVIARLLTPIEVGIFSVSMVLVGFLGPFRDLGASQYVIQCRELSDEILSTTRAIQFGLGLLLALAILASAEMVAAFYGEPRIFSIMLLLALNSLLVPVGALSLALLNREVRFKELALARLAGAVLGALTSIYLAWQQVGPISLAYGAMVGTAATSLGAIYFRPLRLPWLPNLHRIRPIVSFGGAITGISLLGMVRSNVAELALARTQGLAVSGLFGRAQGLVTMLTSLLMDGAYSAALPLFAKALREGKPLGPIYLKAVSFISALGWSLFGLVACTAAPLIHLLYGEQWHGATPMVQSLCVALVFATPNLLSQAPLIAMGKVKITLGFATITTLVQIALVLLAAQHSLEAALTAIIVSSMLFLMPSFAILQHALGFGWRDLGKTLLHSSILAVASLLVPVAILLEYGNQTHHGILRILVSSSGSAAGFIAAAFLTRHPVAQEIKLLVATLRRSFAWQKTV